MAAYPKSKAPILPFQFTTILGEGGMGGWGGREGRRPLVASEISPLTEVASAACDELFGPTSERGNGRRWMATATATLRLAVNELAFLLNSSFLRTVIAISLRSGNRFHFYVIYRIFCSNCWEFKMVHGSSFFCQRNLCIFHASLNIWLSISWFTAVIFCFQRL